MPVGSIGALLADGPVAAGNPSQFIPAYTGMIGSININSMAADNGLVSAKIAVLGRIHDHLRDGIQFLACP